MTALDLMSPSEYIDYMWSEYEKSSEGKTEHYRWKRTGVKPEEIPDYLSEIDRKGRAEAITLALTKFTGMEDAWRFYTAKPMLRAMSSQDRVRCQDLLVSLFPTYSIDSKFARSPRGDRLILVHVGMTQCLYRLLVPFSKVLAGGELNSRDQIEMLSDVSLHWSYGTSLAQVAEPQTNAQALIHAHLIRACEWFVIGHEFGHSVLGHESYSTNTELNHKMEYEADEYGARLLFELLARGIDSQGESDQSTECYGLLAPALVLGSFSIPQTDETSFHPAPLDRMMTFIENYQSYIPHGHTWPKAHLDLVLRNMAGIAQCYYKWAEHEVF